MTDPAHTGRPSAARTPWPLAHPLLGALSRAGVPMAPGDVDQVGRASALGPEFVHALARWIRAAHAGAPPAATSPPTPAAAPLRPTPPPPASPASPACPDRPQGTPVDHRRAG
ncbi:hypothetical protein [Kitasatospora camelliae]|uniref:Uncharacterized protein n=1 Tax=Kitasatospora camelliae TaxID=3156397 RepID=A0AAU8K224_9ACTN